jgi:uncharacterized protein (TIGR00159 family)
MSLNLLVDQFFGWRAAVDILLMSVGLFFLYRTLQRLGTWGIALGILVAMVVYLVASLLDLKGIEWIFGNLSQVAVIALIIIFQPEIRKLFERAASMRRTKPVTSEDALLMTLSNALRDLAQKRQGGIVVLPGNEPIQQWLSGGYQLDGSPSLPLIMSIFDPSSGGHDGALIISKGKIVRFGVRLPVSQSARLSEEYGTRHHAAMGLSERSDALILVVSEERGRISIFKEGKMELILDPEQLSAAIHAHWRETATYSLDLSERKIRRRLIVQMSASLALAVLFWSTLMVVQGEILEKVVTVPVEFTASPPHLVLVGDKDKTVRLHLSGPESDLNTIDPSELNAKIDLSKAVAGKQVFVITAENLRLPRNVRLLDVVPPRVELALAEIMEQEIEIKPQLLGELPANKKITAIKVIPNKVRVLSPSLEDTAEIISVTTTPIYLDSIQADTQIFCKIIAPPAIMPADKRWPDVKVEIRVANLGY